MVNKNYAFANPKAGISYQNRQTKVYLYYGQSSKEPNRDDFESSSSDQVKPERLHDWEAGIEQNGKKGRMERQPVLHVLQEPTGADREDQ